MAAGTGKRPAKGERAMVSARWRSRVLRRRFLREIGSIVLGVLIALGLGAVASEIGWKLEVRQAKQALSNELGEIVGQALQRERADSCIERRLDAIGAILDVSEETGRLPPVGDIGQPLTRTWSTDVWDATRSAEIASHMERGELDDTSGVYSLIAVVKNATEDELRSWIDLYAIVGPGRAIDAGELRALRGALARARAAHRMILGGGIRVDAYVRQFSLPADAGDVAKYRDESIDLVCRSASPYAGEHYGEAPFRGVAARLRKSATLSN